MSARLKGRRREVDRLVRQATAWAETHPDVRALALVGSYAYDAPRMGSDLDLVLLTTDQAAYLDRTDWLPAFGKARLIATRSWGGITERRLRTPSGLHVEVGVGAPSWASVTPVDEGTRRVVSDGLRILYDPQGLLGRLASAG
jgi:uncharacterized protein